MAPGMSMTAKLMAHALIDHAAWKRREVFEHGHVFTVEAGECLFSRTELAALLGATDKQIRLAQEALRKVGFCDFRDSHEGSRARTLYRVTYWWRFIQLGKADELDSAEASPGMTPKGAKSGPSGKADGTGVPQSPDAVGGPDEGRTRAKPRAIDSARVQSSEHTRQSPAAHGRSRSRAQARQPDPHGKAVSEAAEQPVFPDDPGADLRPVMEEDFAAEGGSDAWLRRMFASGKNGTASGGTA